MIKVGIVGATGYTGIELLRLLWQHSEVEISYLTSQKYAGKKISEVYGHIDYLNHLSLCLFDVNNIPKLDVLFLAVPHGNSHTYMKQLMSNQLKIIDLSADFRLNDSKDFEKYYNVKHESSELLDQFVLGFPEIYRKDLASSNYCANPGCYSTSVILGLYPLIKEKIIESQIIVDAKSGLTGAGRSLKENTLYCEANDNISVYSVFKHRHTAEMNQELGLDTCFVPHLSPMNRGILSNIYCKTISNMDEDEIKNIYKKYYANEPFIKLFFNIPSISTKYVTGTNNCGINFNMMNNSNLLVVHSVIDNLIKGSAGAAIHNMNIMCGFKENTGLVLQSPYI